MATLACDAIGAKNVYGISNPSAYSSEHSRTDAADLAERTGLNLATVPIAPMVDAFEAELNLTGLAAENLQARIRAVIWMAESNQHGPSIVLACGNKSELAVGYSTIYGDAVGGFAPIKDVPKTWVWQLAKWRNDHALEAGETPPIPENTILKEPSAELRPGQKDTDSLPPYEILDDILDDYVEGDRGRDEIVAMASSPTWSTGSCGSLTPRSTSAGSTRRGPRSASRPSAATGGCRSPTVGGKDADRGGHHSSSASHFSLRSATRCSACSASSRVAYGPRRSVALHTWSPDSTVRCLRQYHH